MRVNEQAVSQGAVPFGESQIRVFRQDGRVWFLTTDVCSSIGLRKPRDHHRRVPESERTSLRGLGRSCRQAVSEAGFYAIVTRVRTDSPEADAFRSWVTNTLLPMRNAEAMAEQGLGPDLGPDPVETLPAVRVESSRACDPTVVALVQLVGKLEGTLAALVARVAELEARPLTAMPAPATAPSSKPAKPDALDLASRLEHASGEFGFRELAKSGDLNERALSAWLVTSGFAYRLHGTLTASDWAIRRGFAVQRLVAARDRQGLLTARPQMFFTAKGAGHVIDAMRPKPIATQTTTTLATTTQTTTTLHVALALTETPRPSSKPARPRRSARKRLALGDTRYGGSM